MRKATLVLALGILAGTTLAVGQPGIATDAGDLSANLLPIHNKLVPRIPLDSGPSGADQIRYDDGDISNGWYFYDRRSRYAVRMDPFYYPAVVAQCDFRICPEWPFPHHDSIYVQVWFDRDGDSMPDFPAVWSAWAQGSDSAPDTAAVTVPVPLGQVICDSGSFWVGYMVDTVNAGAGYEVVGSDSVRNYPDHQYYYYPPNGVWLQGSYLDNDQMIRSWTMRQGLRNIVVSAIEAPSGEISVGDTVIPRVLLANLGLGADSAWVWMRIEDTSSTDNYVDSCWVRLDPLQMLDTTYRSWSPLYPGVYRMQCTADSSDTNWAYFTVLPREGVDEGVVPPNLARNQIEVGPNPVRSAATIRYYVASESRVKLRILDTRGRVVRTLVSGCTAAGEHSVIWDARDDLGHPVARGIYFVRLESQDRRETRKVVLTR